MSAIEHPAGRQPDNRPAPEAGAPAPDRAQYGLAVLLAGIGGYTIYDATTLKVGFGDPVGPQAFPFVIGGVMLFLAVLLAIATARGDRGTAEAGEDVDLSQGADWVTVLKLVAVLVFTIATIDWLGWAITGALLFAGAAWSLGSRTLIRDLLVGAVLSVGSWYAFYSGLGIALSPGILDGIL